MFLRSISNMVEETEDTMRGDEHNPRRIVLEAKDDEEMDKVKAAVHGALWMHFGRSGKVATAPAYPEPGKVEDPLQLELFWGKALESPTYFHNLAGKESKDDPAFYVQSIGGYSPNYHENAAALEEAGFEVLRSRRSRDGAVWEIWYLPGKWHAKGPIEGKNTKEITNWICHLGVGQISVEGSYYGLSVD